MNLKHSKLYLYNGVTFTLVFLLVRGAFVPYMLFKTMSTLDNPFVHPVSALHTLVLNCGYAFQALQFFWCVKVAQGFITSLKSYRAAPRALGEVVLAPVVECEKKAT